MNRKPAPSAKDRAARHASKRPADVRPDKPAAADDDGALESLGKAVSAPVLGAADEDPDAPAQTGEPPERKRRG